MKHIKFEVKHIHQDDFSAWKALYKKYLEFYHTELDDQQLAILWSWFFDADKKMFCHAAVHENDIIGLIHFREYLRPIKASAAVFIDDLYVDNRFRGMGIARKLINGVNEFALEKKIPLIRWITASDNQDAMRLYDKIANKTAWTTYDLQVGVL